MLAGEFDYFLGSLDGDHFVAKRLESAANQAQVDGGVVHHQNGCASRRKGRGLPGRGVRFASLAGALLGRQESFDLPYKRFGINRLGMYPSNPAIRTLSRSPTMAKAVTATTRTFC